MLALIGLSGCAANQEELELARVGDRAISEDHFTSSFRIFFNRTGRAVPVNSISKKAVLRDEFRSMVFAHHAEVLGIDADPESQHFKGLLIRKAYAEDYLKWTVLDTVRATEREAREYFWRSKTYLRASHLFARTKTEIDSLYRLIQNGADFEEVAAASFNNKYLAENGGDVGLFTLDDMDPYFEDAAYSMSIGDISTPIKTAHGYSIIKLTEVNPEPVVTETEFANKKRAYFTIAQKRAEEYATDEHLEKVISNTTLYKSLMQRMWTQVAQGATGFYAETYDAEWNTDFMGNQKDEIMAVLPDGSEVTAADFWNEAYYSTIASRQQIRTKERFEEFTKGILYRIYAVNQFQQNGWDEREETQKSIEYTFDKYLARRIQEQVESGISFPEHLLQADYERFKQDYYSPKLLRLSKIEVNSEEKGKRAKQELEQGAAFAEVLKKYTSNSELLMTNGDMGYVPVAELGVHGLKLVKLKEGEVSDPLEYHSNEFFVYKVTEIVESLPLSFDEAKEQIEGKLTQLQLKKELKDLYARLIDEYDAEINEEMLTQITIQL